VDDGDAHQQERQEEDDHMLEVERFAESNRFVAKLLAEKTGTPPRQATPAPRLPESGGRPADASARTPLISTQPMNPISPRVAAGVVTA
jgi:hypothetical protein